MSSHIIRVPLSEEVPSLDSFERTFYAPFSVINAAVYHAITIRMAQHGVLPPHDDTSGATRYTFCFSTGEKVFIFVLQRGENITTIEIHPVVPKGGQIHMQSETIELIGYLLADCILEAGRAMRYTHPEFTIQPIEGVTPPMPVYQRDGWRAVFLWQALHATSMTDEEIAQTQCVSLQHVSNKRHQLNAQKRPRKVSKIK